MNSKHLNIKTIFLIAFTFFAQYEAFCKVDVWVRPHEIKFNHQTGNAYDAQKIGINYGTDVPVPEWRYNGGIVISGEFAYIKEQENRIIMVSFDSNYSGSMHLLLKITTTSGNSIGEVCNLFIPNYTKLNFININLTGSIPNSVGKRSFTWNWEIYAIPNDLTNYCAASTNTSSTHSYYTLFSTPVSPCTIPYTNILDYACDWANGATDEGSVCSNILNYGFNLHYTWNGDCHYLSSDFVRLVSSLGVTASLHRWSAPGVYLNDMIWQITRQIDPVGSEPLNVYRFWFHQWAEAASAQRDPSTNTTFTGTWGNYEDYLFTNYDYITKVSPETIARVQNQLGQPIGSCEDYISTVRHAEHATDYIIQTWRGPDR